MEDDKSDQNTFDIQVAQRKYLAKDKSRRNRLIILISPFIFLIASILLINNQNKSIYRSINDDFQEKDNGKILGHLPYKEISKDKLVKLESGIFVHHDMYEPLLRMKADAKDEGVFLVFLSGYRSIELQKEIFYSLKALRNQEASERAKVSAPPGFSEHSTGFAIDIGDAQNRETDFEPDFENTNAFIWLKRNAAKYHFKLSFNKDHDSVDYEPWHWRYEGSIEALKIFESSNRK